VPAMLDPHGVTLARVPPGEAKRIAGVWHEPRKRWRNVALSAKGQAPIPGIPLAIARACER